MNPHERAFVHAFIEPSKIERYLHHLTSKKYRRRILDRLNHKQDFRHGVEIPIPAKTSADDVVTELRQRGAGDHCYVIADSSHKDGQELELTEAIDFMCNHHFAVIISCVPGKLACYKPESPGEPVLLAKSD
jgi:hypothetical protein